MPGAFDPKAPISGLGSTLGKQIPSRRRSASAYSFGTADKSANPKIFISPGHNHTFYGSHSPGAKYDVARAIRHTTVVKTSPAFGFGSGGRHDFTQGGEKKTPGPKYTIPNATFGPQVLSSYKSSSGSSFGVGSRDQAARASLSKEMAQSPNFALEDSPGPCAYTLPVSLGRQTATRNGGMEPKPECAIGLEERFLKHSGLGTGTDSTPGPATAVAGSMLGTQRLARFKSSPMVGFGKGDSRAHSFAADANRSPGPIYSPYSSVGKQVLTGSRTPPRFTFGSSQRDTFKHVHGATTPGPGAYNPA